jgi:hypothetical protein
VAAEVTLPDFRGVRKLRVTKQKSVLSPATSSNYSCLQLPMECNFVISDAIDYISCWEFNDLTEEISNQHLKCASLSPLFPTFAFLPLPLELKEINTAHVYN